MFMVELSGIEPGHRHPAAAALADPASSCRSCHHSCRSWHNHAAPEVPVAQPAEDELQGEPPGGRDRLRAPQPGGGGGGVSE